jgi:hypothetical protein
MDCESAGKALIRQPKHNLPKLNFIISLPKKIDYCPREVPSGMARLACCAPARSGKYLGLEEEVTGRRSGKVQRRDELARRGRSILGLTPALNFRQDELQSGDGLRYGQMARMADAATIRVRWPIMVMNLFGNSGSGLENGKADKKEQYQGCPPELTELEAAPHHHFEFRPSCVTSHHCGRSAAGERILFV